MKKVFLRILPLATAVLFATSCSKDDKNVSDEPVNNGQETVVNQEKTITVSGTLSKQSGISKISCADGVNLTFDGNETLKFSSEDGKIHGETTLNTEAGKGTVSFSVELFYPAENYDITGKTVTATIGTEPTGVTGSYNSFDEAAKDVYEVSKPITINFADGKYSFSGTLEMGVEVAFVKNECTEVAINVQVGSNEPVALAGGKICIVPAGVKVTAADMKTKNTTVGGEIYKIAPEPLSLNWGTAKEIVWGNNTQTITATIIPAQRITWSYDGGNENNVYTFDDNTFSVFVKGTGNFKITATAEDGTTATCDITVPAEYVDLIGDGALYWYVDEWGPCTWADRDKNLPTGARVAEAQELDYLVPFEGEPQYYNRTFTEDKVYVSNKNGSGAQISMSVTKDAKTENQWNFGGYKSNTEFYEDGVLSYWGIFVCFSYNTGTGKYNRGDYAWAEYDKPMLMRLVRDAKQN